MPSPHPPVRNSRSGLRREMREQRRALSPAARDALAGSLAIVIATAVLRRRADRIACYLSNDGEMDLGRTIERLWGMGRHCYLPVLRGPRLWFLPYTETTPLDVNRFGIAEPALPPGTRCPPRALDLVLMPLVAFDTRGNRVGMGGGFYDRTFAYLVRRRHWKKPALIGVAYDFQCVSRLAAKEWDVPLDGVVTESGVRRFTTRR